MTADQLLAAVAPLGVRGLHIGDLSDSSTWTFDGDGIDHAAVVAAVQAVVRGPVQPVSHFWPAAPTPLERDVALLKARLTGG